MKDPAGAVFAALADPTRRRVVHELSKDGPLTATELAKRIPVTRQAIAKHFARWRRRSSPSASASDGRRATSCARTRSPRPRPGCERSARRGTGD